MKGQIFTSTPGSYILIYGYIINSTPTRLFTSGTNPDPVTLTSDPDLDPVLDPDPANLDLDPVLDPV